MTESALVVPEAVSFEQAIDLTQALIDRMSTSGIPDAEIEQVVGALVQTVNGARGFFVAYLADERSPADEPVDAILAALQTSPAIVADLLVKNLAMSSAMAITHRRNQDEAMAQGSDRVRSRSMNLIQQLRSPELQTRAQQLHESASTGIGEDLAFLNRWNYDAEQRQAIILTIRAAIVESE